MAQRTEHLSTPAFAARGLALAEQRMAYLTDLYDTGRWRRFHKESEFLRNVREVKAAIEIWQRLAAAPPAAVPSPVGSRLHMASPQGRTPAPVSKGPPLDALPVVLPALIGGIASDCGIDLDTEESSASPMMGDGLVGPTDPFQSSMSGQDYAWRNEQAAAALWQGSRALLPDISFSADSVGGDADLREA